MDQMLFWLAPIASILALGFAWYFYRQMMKESGHPKVTTEADNRYTIVQIIL